MIKTIDKRNQMKVITAGIDTTSQNAVPGVVYQCGMNACRQCGARVKFDSQGNCTVINNSDTLEQSYETFAAKNPSLSTTN